MTGPLIALSGKCPPEDVGGPPGYENFLEAIADPKHPEHVDIMEWNGMAQTSTQIPPMLMN